MDTSQLTLVTTRDELRAVVGEPIERVQKKVRPALHELHRAWLRHSPFCLVATAAADGSCDVSPKGDPAGVAHVLDEHTLVLADRPGNRRVDGFLNVLTNPHVGLIFLIPGRGDTLRVNGRALLVREAPFFDDLVVGGHRPSLALVVEVEEVFFHCAKALLRSRLWDAASWRPEAAPSRALVAKGTDRPDDTLAELERYYDEAGYAAALYATDADSSCGPA